jgi:hypothetical protein
MQYKAIAAGLGAASLRDGNSGCRGVGQKQLQQRGGWRDGHAGTGPNHDGHRVVCAGGQGNTALRVREFVLTVSR